MINVNLIYPIGSIYISDSSKNPSNLLGGTWKLIDKRFSSRIITDGFDFDTSNKSNYVSQIITSGHSIDILIYFVPTLQIGDSIFEIGTFNFEKIGITEFNEVISACGFSDGGNAIVMGQSFGDNNDTFSTTDVVGPDNVPANQSIRFRFTTLVSTENMLDSACDKFYWKRTA